MSTLRMMTMILKLGLDNSLRFLILLLGFIAVPSLPSAVGYYYSLAVIVLFI